MPISMEFTVCMTVSSEQEAYLIQDAVHSGLAAELIRLGVLYGHVPVGGTSVGVPPASSADYARQQELKQREASMELKRVENKVGRAVAPAEPEPKAPRKPGLAGHKRLGRT